MARISQCASGLGPEVAKVRGALDDTSRIATAQTAAVLGVCAEVGGIVQALREVSLRRSRSRASPRRCGWWPSTPRPRPSTQAKQAAGQITRLLEDARRSGLIARHNRQSRQVQRPGDVAWNAAHCRNRRIFNDRTGLASARNQRPFLLQTCRRDMRGGVFVLLKEASAPTQVVGRHCGGLRLACKF